MPSARGRFGPLIGAIDEGTSSVRFIVFSPRTSEVIAMHQIPLKLISPQNGWVEQDPMEIIRLLDVCIEETLNKLLSMEVESSDIVAVGVTNQRETVVAWDNITGEPLYNAVVWSDVRAEEIVTKLKENLPDKNVNYWTPICGLPLISTFSAPKIKWLLEEVPAIKKAAGENRLYFGTIDSWIIYNLTGGKNGGIHVTDCTNASRTLLMNLETVQWDIDLCQFFEIDSKYLPEIRSCSEIYGKIREGPLQDVPISGCLGDQQAALLGQLCLEQGQAKSTYGTGCFLLCNTGTKKIKSKHGLITTIAFQLGPNNPIIYALEGSVAVAGAALNWLRDNLGILDDAHFTKAISEAIAEAKDVYFVPAFSGLYAPYWVQDARGIIVGITENTKNSHFIRAALEAVCFQTRDIVEAMEKDCGFSLKELLVDGGMTKNDLIMQLQADLTGVSVVKPTNSEMTALGAAIAAGRANGVDVWNFEKMATAPNKVFLPALKKEDRDARYTKWKEAVKLSFGWNIET